MAVSSSTIVQSLWKYCNVLSDDGLSYGDGGQVRNGGGVGAGVTTEGSDAVHV